MPYMFWPDELKAKWKDWEKWRTSVNKQKGFKDEQREANQKRLDSFSKEIPEVAIRILQEAMDCGWKQFYELKTGNNGNNQGGAGNSIQAGSKIDTLRNW